MYLRRRLWDSSLSVAYRSEKRDTSRACREELVSCARVGDSPLTGLTERLRRGRGLGEPLLTNLEMRQESKLGLRKSHLHEAMRCFHVKRTSPVEQFFQR